MKRISYLLAAVFSLALFFGSNLQAAEPPKEPILQLETQTHSARVSKIAVDKNGRILASASYDKTVRIWDLKTGKLLKILRPPINERQDGELYALAISPDGKTIACGGYTGVDWQDRAIYLFDADSGNLKKRITGTTDVPLYLEYSKDGKYLVALFPSRKGLNLYRTSDYTLIAHDSQYNAYFNTSTDFAPHKDDASHRFITASRDGFIRLYEIKAGSLKLLDKVQPPGGKHPQTAKFSPDGTLIAVGFQDSINVAILSGINMTYLYSTDTTGVQNRNLSSVSWSADGKSLYAGGLWGGTQTRIVIRKWLDRGKGAFSDTHVESSIQHMAALPDGGMAFGTYKGFIGVVDDKDERAIFAPSAGADFGEILVSHDAMTVGFRYHKNSPQFLFSIENHVLQMSTKDVQLEKLKKPIYSTEKVQVTDWLLTHVPKVNGKVIKIAPWESSRCYTVVPDGDMVLHGSDRHLRLLDKNAIEIWRTWLNEIPVSVNVSGNGKVAVTALGNGTIQWFRIEDGKKLLSFFPHNDKKRWVAWTEGGYYDASENADELIGWHVNRGADQEALYYPLARFFEKYYRPEVIDGVIRSLDTDMGIIAKTDKGKTKQAQQAKEVVSIKPPPRVTITKLGNGKAPENEEVKIKVIAEDMGGGIDDIWLFHNGKRVMEGEKNTKIDKTGSAIEKIYNLRLLEGENYFSAAAFSQERVESDPAELMVALAGVGKTPDLHLVLIGVDKYMNPTLNLGYAGLDAKSMEEFFVSDPVRKLFGNTFIYKLMNDKVTKNNIIKLFEDVKVKALQKDAVVLYMAGHGDVVGNEWFLIPHDVTTPEDETQVKSLGLSTQDIIETLKHFKAQKILVVIDACKSGGVISGMGGLRGYEDRKVMKQLVRSTGTYVISASNDKQFALELKELGHGVFTFTMLEGLKGKAGEKKVTVEGLIQYVKNRLPELSEKYRGNPQWPVSWGAGMDFPLALY
jgi:WD40 repeat protein